MTVEELREQGADIFAVVCNYREDTNTSRQGGKAYLADYHWSGGGYERVRVVARSRGGRWILKWETAKRLTNFRSTTIPAAHPDYRHENIGWHPNRADADAFAGTMMTVSRMYATASTVRSDDP